MKRLKRFAIVAVLTLAALPLAAAADPPAASQAVLPDSALTARFTTFLTDVLAGHLPATGVSDAVKSGFTPDLLAQVDSSFAALGVFQNLQYVSQDTMQGYQRYHYVAVFDKGTQPLLFVLDSNGDIAGFFKSP